MDEILVFPSNGCTNGWKQLFFLRWYWWMNLWILSWYRPGLSVRMDEGLLRVCLGFSEPHARLRKPLQFFRVSPVVDGCSLGCFPCVFSGWFCVLQQCVQDYECSDDGGKEIVAARYGSNAFECSFICFKTWPTILRFLMPRRLRKQERKLSTSLQRNDRCRSWWKVEGWRSFMSSLEKLGEGWETPGTGDEVNGESRSRISGHFHNSLGVAC